MLEAIAAAEEAEVQVITVAMLGHKGDVAVMALADDQWKLRTLQTDLVAAGLDLVDSYVSLTDAPTIDLALATRAGDDSPAVRRVAEIVSGCV